jgi:hypothetical protein
MTEQTARTVANVVIGAAAIGVAYVVLRTPSLRRMAARLLVAAVTGGVPAWIGREVHHAWDASAGGDDGRGVARQSGL